jgi:3-hydroxyisobutyrate dehydrogenase
MGDPERIIHVGGHGAGYTVKLMLNLLWFSSVVNLAEVLAVGVRAGVELEVLHRALVAGPTNSVLLERDILPLLREGDYEKGFALALACKDLGLAVDLARSVGVPVESSALVEQIVRRARAAYGDDAGELSAVRLYEDLVGAELRMKTGPDPATDPPAE